MKINYDYNEKELKITLSLNKDDFIKYQLSSKDLDLIKQCSKSKKLSLKLFGLAFLSDKLESIFKILEDTMVN